MNRAAERLIAGQVPYVLVGLKELPEHPVILSGSFNPLHKGHIHLLHAAEKVSERVGLLELSATNVDKPPLGMDELERRVRAMEQYFNVVLTRASTFAEKAELFPGAWFAMGFDTAIRLLDARYNADVPAMLNRFDQLEVRFVVAGRLHAGEYRPLWHLEIPPGYEHLFIPIPESIFREDISSTELRKRRN